MDDYAYTGTDPEAMHGNGMGMQDAAGPMHGHAESASDGSMQPPSHPHAMDAPVVAVELLQGSAGGEQASVGMGGSAMQTPGSAGVGSAHFARPGPQPYMMEDDEYEDLDPDAMLDDFECGVHGGEEQYAPEDEEAEDEQPQQHNRNGQAARAPAMAPGAGHGVAHGSAAVSGSAAFPGAGIGAGAGAGARAKQARPVAHADEDEDDLELQLSMHMAGPQAAATAAAAAAAAAKRGAGLSDAPNAKRAKVANNAVAAGRAGRAAAGGSGAIAVAAGSWPQGDVEEEDKDAYQPPAASRRAPPQRLVVNVSGECMAVTGASGERVYCEVGGTW